jgi:hypothetical protein
MGHRTVKRVPTDFDYPIGEIWYGYYLSYNTCLEVDGKEDLCPLCKNFAKHMGYEFGDYGCPKYPKQHVFEPPKGEGWQMWETTSEGSPQSPVFQTAEELAEWCEENATVFASEKTSKENWLKMFNNIESMGEDTLMLVRPGYVGAIINDERG